jgi:GH25 family lysozyme M1 (1,4-beta-N-acetylmuramidase)
MYPAAASAVRPLGIDVSQFQGTIDWAQVKASGRDFAFIRASHGSLQDPKFLTNIVAAKAAGVLVSPYHYAVPVYDSAYSISGSDPVTDANYFLNMARNYIVPGNLRPMLDLELGGGETPVGATNLATWAQAWINYVKSQTGVEAMVYCNQPYACNYLTGSSPTLGSSRVLVFADWEDTPPTNTDTASPDHSTCQWSTWTFWQYSNMGNIDGWPSVPGIPARVDLDMFNGTAAQMQSYVITQTAIITRSPTTLTRTVRQGRTPADQTFTIKNSGTGTMIYDIGITGAWLTCTPTSGTCTTATNRHTVSYSTTGLTAGTYNGTLSITCPLANNSPQAIGVTLIVTPIPGDFDHDNDIDTSDFATFATCMTAPGAGPPASGCSEADVDGDNDVDQIDFGIIQLCASGVGVAGDPNCAP